MKKLLYTILSMVSVAYICFLIVDVLRVKTNWNPDMGGFTEIFNFIVRFGGIAIIFCFALVNFAGSPNPLKTVFFIVLIVAIVFYVIVLAAPDFIYKLFGGKEQTEAIIAMLKL